MMHSTSRLSLGLAVLTALFATSAAAQDFKWQGRVDRGDSVTIRGVNGKVVAKPARGDEVIVEANKDAHGDDPDSVKIQVIEDSRGVLVCAVYPSRRGREPNRCARGDDYEMNVHNNDVEVDFMVYVPSDVDLDALTVNGGVKVRGVTGDVDAVTVNGGIDVESAGVVSATTVNGSIEVSMGTPPDDDLEFKTVNGGVRLEVPGDTNADIEASTVNGHIKSDFPLSMRGRWGPREASGEIGKGGPKIELNTVNGSIRLVSD